MKFHVLIATKLVIGQISSFLNTGLEQHKLNGKYLNEDSYIVQHKQPQESL